VPIIKKVAGKLVVARGDAPPVFDAAEEVFDFVSLAVEAFGVHFVNSARVGGEDKTFNLVTDLPLLRKTTVYWDIPERLAA
jgi:hypothetical protein